MARGGGGGLIVLATTGLGLNGRTEKDYSRHLLYLPSRFLICCFSPGCVLSVGGRHRDGGPHELLIARSGSHGVVSPAHFVYELTEQTSLVFGTACAIRNVTCPRDRTSDRPVAICRSTTVVFRCLLLAESSSCSCTPWTNSSPPAGAVYY